MPGIEPMIDAAAARRLGETPIVLPDAERASTDPVFRPTLARHVGATVILLEVGAQPGQTVSVRAPLAAALRQVTIPPLGASGLSTLVELSPMTLRAEARAVFGQLGAVPTFYLGLPNATLADDDLVEIGQELDQVSGGQSAWIGAVFSDNVTRTPGGWIEAIARALEVVEPASTWPTLLGLFDPGERHLFVLDHAGAPAEQLTFQIRLSGEVAPRWLRTLPPGVSDLEQVVAADPLDGVTSLFSTSAGGQAFELRADFGPDGIPVQSLLELDAATLGDGFLAVPPTGPATLHLQVLDLAAWYPPPSTPSTIARFRAGSRLEPLVEGIPALARLVQDLKLAERPGHGAQFTGWAFNRFVLDAADGRNLVEIADDILQAGGDFRLLATKFIQDEENFDDPNDPLLSVLFLLLFIAGQGALWVDHARKTADPPGTSITLLTPFFAGLTLAALAGQIREIIEFLEPSGELMPQINALTSGGPIAIHARNPARLRDNPLPPSDLPLNLDEVSDHFGIWHNKAQFVKYEAASGVTEHAVYVGGIDINANRLDTPAHNGPSPYHDVHCRVTGPIVHDAWISFNERWAFDRQGAPGAPDPIPVPSVDDLPVRPQRHIARIGRTYAGVRPDGNSTPLPFAPDGERSIYDTLIAALRSARRSILIEEQYFASEGTVAPPNLGEGSFHAELLNAASQCERLTIVLPFLGDQPWAEGRRRRIISELRDAWGSRLLVGFPQRRPALGEGQTVAAVGRTRLLDDITASQTQFRLAPAVRVPATAFWMWVDGELMLVHSTTRITVEGEGATEVDVVRAITPSDPARWFSTPRAHKKGAPVTHSRLASIYVHAKMMVVDDVFVSIGSANLNRRGFFFDGEMNAFAIPERLAAAPDNPARSLRQQLFAQHLGLPPAMGAALFGDPVGDVDFLHRSPWLGNRFTPLDAADLTAQLALVNNEITDGSDMMKVFLKFAGLQVIEANRDRIWNQASDPTSFVDPHPIPETF
jgi:phosphatidylserine/phosphatidylglycerophosphate/cardiolipin synthase-like enzyme